VTLDPEQERAGEIPDQPGIDAAKKIGKHLLKDYNPEAFPNPGESTWHRRQTVIDF
jgi:hypothetical protein